MSTSAHASAKRSRARRRLRTLAATALAVVGVVSAAQALDMHSVIAPTPRQTAAWPNVWAVGDAAVARCHQLPDGYEPREDALPITDDYFNVWAVGDAAVAQHFDELSRTCPAH